MDAAQVPTALSRLRAGARIRLFWIEQGDRYSASGTLLSAGPAEVRIAPDEGGELTVPMAAVNCFYLPKPPGGGPSLLARLWRAQRGAGRSTGPDDQPGPVAGSAQRASASSRTAFASRSTRPRSPADATSARSEVASEDSALPRADPLADSALANADRTAAMRAAGSPELRSS